MTDDGALGRVSLGDDGCSKLTMEVAMWLSEHSVTQLAPARWTV